MKNLNDLDSFLKDEEEITKETLSHFKKEFELYERSFNLLLETVSYLCDLTTKEKPFGSMAKDAIMFIMPRIVQSMQSIRILSLKGYYYDVSVLRRSLIESIGLCAYFALNEKEAKNWLEGKDVKMAKIRLFDYIPKLLGREDDSGKSVYGQLSRYVHTNIRAIVTLIFKQPKTRGLGLKFGPEFDKEDMDEISAYPTLMSLMLMKIFKDELTEKGKEKITRFLEQYKAEKKLMKQE